MRKLHLDPDSLVVQSFETADGAAGAGTVRGHADAQPIGVPPGDSGCVATYDPCTCVPIETCSCGPDTPDPTTGWQ